MAWSSSKMTRIENLLKDSSPLRDRTKYAIKVNMPNVRYDENMRYDVTYMCID